MELDEKETNSVAKLKLFLQNVHNKKRFTICLMNCAQRALQKGAIKIMDC